MDIFDRYGKLIFHSEEVDLGWNGYDNKGKPIKTTGTYVYVVNFRDTITNLQHRRKGSVTLIVSED
jgi:gliding motility-associated-like protein